MYIVSSHLSKKPVIMYWHNVTTALNLPKHTRNTLKGQYTVYETIKVLFMPRFTKCIMTTNIEMAESNIYMLVAQNKNQSLTISLIMK